MEDETGINGNCATMARYFWHHSRFAQTSANERRIFSAFGITVEWLACVGSIRQFRSRAGWQPVGLSLLFLNLMLTRLNKGILAKSRLKPRLISIQLLVSTKVGREMLRWPRWNSASKAVLHFPVPSPTGWPRSSNISRNMEKQALLTMISDLLLSVWVPIIACSF